MDRPRPRALFVGRTRYRLPLEGELERKFAALRDELELRVLACAADRREHGDGTFELVHPFRPRQLDGLVFQLVLPALVARQIRTFDPDAVFAEGTQRALAALLGRRLARRRTPVVLEVHGDWRAVTRLYGSRFRRLLDPLADRLSVLALHRADAVRTLSPATTRLVLEHGVEPDATFPAYVDVDTFLGSPPRPLPERPQALFVGVLERYKNVDGLVRAWRLAARHVPQARLRIVGDGRLRALVEELGRDLPHQTTWEPALSPGEIADAMDESSLLFLPSRSEGLPRVAIEALSRGRPVVATPVGGVPDLIDHGVNGLLVADGEPATLAEALIRSLGDPAALEPLARRARESVRPWLQTPETFARRMRNLAVAAGGLDPEPEAQRAPLRAA